MPKKRPNKKKKNKAPIPITPDMHKRFQEAFEKASQAALERIAKRSRNPAVTAIAKIRAEQIKNGMGL